MKSLVVTMLMGVSFWLGMASNVGAERPITPIKFVSDGPKPEPASYCTPFYRSLPCPEQNRICRARERTGKVKANG